MSAFLIWLLQWLLCLSFRLDSSHHWVAFSAHLLRCVQLSPHASTHRLLLRFFATLKCLWCLRTGESNHYVCFSLSALLSEKLLSLFWSLMHLNLVPLVCFSSSKCLPFFLSWAFSLPHFSLRPPSLPHTSLFMALPYRKKKWRSLGWVWWTLTFGLMCAPSFNLGWLLTILYFSFSGLFENASALTDPIQAFDYHHFCYTQGHWINSPHSKTHPNVSVVLLPSILNVSQTWPYQYAWIYLQLFGSSSFINLISHDPFLAKVI